MTETHLKKKKDFSITSEKTINFMLKFIQILNII